MRCWYVTTDAVSHTANECPQCHTKIQPVFLSEDVTLTLNWLELRALVNWADAFLKSITMTPETREMFTNIVAQIQDMRPPDAEPLTITEQFAALHKALPDSDLSRIGDVILSKRAAKAPTVN